VSSHSRHSPFCDAVLAVVDREHGGGAAVAESGTTDPCRSGSRRGTGRDAPARAFLAQNDRRRTARPETRLPSRRAPGSARGSRGMEVPYAFRTSIRQSRPSFAEIPACSDMSSWKRGTRSRIAGDAQGFVPQLRPHDWNRRGVGEVRLDVENRRARRCAGRRASHRVGGKIVQARHGRSALGVTLCRARPTPDRAQSLPHFSCFHLGDLARGAVSEDVRCRLVATAAQAARKSGSGRSSSRLAERPRSRPSALGLHVDGVSIRAGLAG